MTTLEFSNEFDISYNSIATNSAPPLDLYEKSVYLTKAQLEIVKNYFNPNGNKYKKGFEQSSKRRADLGELIRGYSSTITVSSNDGISSDSQFFRIPNNTFLIIQEKAQVQKDVECLGSQYLNVVPKTHDEFNLQSDNPFKQPNKTVVWRLDYYSQSGNNKNVELISPYTLSQYKFRYIIYPDPIVLTDLLSLYPGETLSIDEVSQEQTCKLHKSVHREILDRAVELALADYKPGSLPVKAQINTRNE
jgi:hypothetical protein